MISKKDSNEKENNEQEEFAYFTVLFLQLKCYKRNHFLNLLFLRVVSRETLILSFLDTEMLQNGFFFRNLHMKN
jgi:hypothetical protein